jgi:uncharacterized protein (DUF433 family)
MAKGVHKCDIYGGQNPLDLPAYALVEIAHCLRVPRATLRAWSLGRGYPSASGQKRAAPLIQIADRHTPALSFRNVVELHVLSAIRRKHRVEMSAVRRAIAYLRSQLHVDQPLADQQMATDGKDLFVERYGRLVNISRGGQLEMKSLVKVFLSRIDRSPSGLPIRLFPFTRPRVEESPRSVVMDPTVQFGRPCIAGTGIATSIIAERYMMGDSVAELAEDYAQETLNIEEALRYELEARAA